MGGMGEARGVPKFFGVVVGYNHCRTIPPSLLTVGIIPIPLFIQRVLPLFSTLSRFLFHPSTRTPLSYFVSRHCPFQSPRDCGANTARYRINFLSRGCRDFTLLERRHWGGRSQKTPRRLGSRGVEYSRLGVEARVRVKSSREEN